jgi:hypothetical protein
LQFGSQVRENLRALIATLHLTNRSEDWLASLRILLLSPKPGPKSDFV